MAAGSRLCLIVAGCKQHMDQHVSHQQTRVREACGRRRLEFHSEDLMEPSYWVLCGSEIFAFWERYRKIQLLDFYIVSMRRFNLVSFFGDQCFRL